MSGDVQVRFCERPGARLPRATHRNIYIRSRRAGERVKASVTRFLERRLKLSVNEAKSARGPALQPEVSRLHVPRGRSPRRKVSAKSLAFKA